MRLFRLRPPFDSIARKKVACAPICECRKFNTLICHIFARPLPLAPCSFGHLVLRRFFVFVEFRGWNKRKWSTFLMLNRVDTDVAAQNSKQQPIYLHIYLMWYVQLCVYLFNVWCVVCVRKHKFQRQFYDSIYFCAFFLLPPHTYTFFGVLCLLIRFACLHSLHQQFLELLSLKVCTHTHTLYVLIKYSRANKLRNFQKQLLERGAWCDFR